MAEIKNMVEIIRPALKKLFDNFFEDKYNQETRESIFADLYKMFYENLIDEIYFCFFDSVVKKIVGGYSLQIRLNQATNLIPLKSYDLKKINLSESTDKFLIIKLNEKGINTSESLNELNNNWDFLKEQKINKKTEKKQLLWVDDIQIELQEVDKCPL